MIGAAGKQSDAEAGVTLIETLVALAIFSICFAVIIGGITTSVITSDHQRKEAKAEALLRQFAEDQKQQTYVACSATPTTTTTTLVGSTVYALSFSSGIQYWNGTTFVNACPSPDQGLQRLTLRVQSTDGRSSETVQIVKRKP